MQNIKSVVFIKVHGTNRERYILDFQTVLMFTLGSYLFLRLSSNLPYPHNRLYGLSHFGVIFITIIMFCATCLIMCHDQMRVGRVPENANSLFRVIKESHQLERELKHLDLSSPRDQRRLTEITKRLKEIHKGIEEAGARLRGDRSGSVNGQE